MKASPPRAGYAASQLPALSGIITHGLLLRASMLPHPLQHRQVPAPSGVCPHALGIPRAVVLPRPPYHRQAPLTALVHVLAFHGQSCSRAHFTVSPSATNPLVRMSHRQRHPFAFAQVSRSTDVQNALSLSRTVTPFGTVTQEIRGPHRRQPRPPHLREHGERHGVQPPQHLRLKDIRARAAPRAAARPVTSLN